MFHSMQIAIATLMFSAILGTATTEAGVVKYSTSFESYHRGPLFEFDFTMPKYAGSVTSVTLSMEGQSQMAETFAYSASIGLSVPTSPVSWDVELGGQPGFIPLMFAHVDTYLNGITIDPCLDPETFGGDFQEVVLSTDVTSYSAVTSVSNLSDFEGHGENSFFVASYIPTDFYGYLSGTVTETMVTVPEPSTWAMMLLGCAGLGFAGYRRSLAA